MFRTAKPGHIWVYTQAGCEHYERVKRDPDDKRYPGQPVVEHYKHKCPLTWVECGWVQEVPIDETETQIKEAAKV